MRTVKTIHDYEHLDLTDENFIFRGQANDSYELLPGTYRPENDVKIQGPKLEIDCIRSFIYHLWERGYHTFPEDINAYNIFTTSSCVFPTDDMLPYMAVAQHYVCDSEYYWLTTSLLDITYSLDIAAYFAINADFEHDGKIFVFNKSTIKPPYMVYEPHLSKRKEARMIVQNGAFIYRQQEYQSEGEMFSYRDLKSFDDIVEETIIIPSFFKEELRDHLRKKLFDNILLPKLILGPITVYMPSTGKRIYDELLMLHKQEIDRAQNAGNRHSNY